MEKTALNRDNIKVAYGKRNFEGNMRNFTLSGLEFHSNHKMPCFVKVELQLRIPDMDYQIACTGTVIMSEALLEGSKYNTVIYFDESSKEE